MDKFPEVVCGLSILEELYYSQHTNTLPEAFVKLEKLRVADFSNGFNKGSMDASDSWDEGNKYYKQIPELLAQLPALEHLNVDCCGVTDLDWIEGAPALKSISFAWSGVEDLTPLSTIFTLEEVSCKSSSNLRDISPLKVLPKFKRLDISRIYSLKELKDISEFRALELLNIEGNGRIKNIADVMSHKTLRELHADDELMEKWQQKKHL